MNIFKSFQYSSRNNNFTIGAILLCYIILNCFIVGFSLEHVLFIILIQIFIVFIAISNIGSWILRVIYKAQKVKDNHHLIELFEEVYEEVKEKFPNCPNNIELYYDRDMTVNAYAVGSNTIAITKGSVESLNDDQIKGILAHEFGHIVHKDTTIPLVLLIGNGIFLFFFLLLRISLVIYSVITVIVNGEEGESRSKFVNTIVNLLISVFLFVLNAVLLINQRKNEYKADYFAFELDYGEELLNALKLLDRLDLSGNRSLLDKIKASHPYTTDRIYQLEKVLNDENHEPIEPRTVNKSLLFHIFTVLGIGVFLLTIGIMIKSQTSKGICDYCGIYYDNLKRFSYDGEASHYNICEECYEDAENNIIDLGIL
jgi:heat shock protein HtpX